jgi:hypothetical protein
MPRKRATRRKSMCMPRMTTGKKRHVALPSRRHGSYVWVPIMMQAARTRMTSSQTEPAPLVALWVCPVSRAVKTTMCDGTPRGQRPTARFLAEQGHVALIQLTQNFLERTSFANQHRSCPEGTSDPRDRA